MANEHLKRTPTSTGNRKKWTWAGWVKLNKDFGSSNLCFCCWNKQIIVIDFTYMQL